jgi:hypothetical protein
MTILVLPSRTHTEIRLAMAISYHDPTIGAFRGTEVLALVKSGGDADYRHIITVGKDDEERRSLLAEITAYGAVCASPLFKVRRFAPFHTGSLSSLIILRGDRVQDRLTLSAVTTVLEIGWLPNLEAVARALGSEAAHASMGIVRVASGYEAQIILKLAKKCGVPVTLVQRE